MDKTDSIVATTPGEILRGARELQGWSIESVAEELRLLPDVVEALENDDYSHTAGWTYAVGYLRNYARLAGVSIEQAITDRKELLPPKEDGPGTMTEPVRNRMQPIAIQYRWVATGAVLLNVLLFLFGAFVISALIVALFALVAGLLLKYRYWHSIDGAHDVSTLGTDLKI